MRNKLLQDLTKSLRLGTESAELEMTAEDPGVLESETVQANTIEDVAEDKADAELIEASDDSLDDEEAVEELVAVVESATASGKGLSRIEAAALKVTFAQITGKYFQDPMAQFPARESNDAMDISNTNLATESLKESAKKIGGSIIAKIKEIVAKVMDFISRMTNKFVWLENRAKKVFAGYSKIDEVVPGSAQVKAQYMGINNELSIDIIKNGLQVTDQIDGVYFHSPVAEILRKFNLSGETMAVNTPNGETSHTKIFSDINEVVKDTFDKASEGMKVYGPGNKMVPEDVKAFVELPGNNYYGFIEIDGKGLFCPVAGKLDRKYDADAAKTTLEFPTKEVGIELSRHISKVVHDMKGNSAKTLKRWRENNLSDDIQRKSGNTETRHDTTEKESQALVLKYIKNVAGLHINFEKFNFDFLNATLDWLGAALQNKEIEG